MNFAALDLNLLRVFDAMMIERHTARAGGRVGLSQPAVSSALGRLRHVTGDELFVRERNRMVPTIRAEELAGPVREALGRLEQALAEAASFDAGRAFRRFRILGSDYFSSLLMPPLAALTEGEAPGIVLQMLDIAQGSGPEAPLAEGTVDLAVDRGWSVPDWIGAETLFVSHLVGVAAWANPALTGLGPGARIPVEILGDVGHVLVSTDGGLRGTIDDELEALGVRRRVALTLPHFHAAAMAVASSALVAALPVHFARAVAPRLGLRIFDLPVSGPRMEVRMYWHTRHDRDAASRWLRDRIRAACREIDCPV